MSNLEDQYIEETEVEAGEAGDGEGETWLATHANAEGRRSDCPSVAMM